VWDPRWLEDRDAEVLGGRDAREPAAVDDRGDDREGRAREEIHAGRDRGDNAQLKGPPEATGGGGVGEVRPPSSPATILERSDDGRWHVPTVVGRDG